MSGNELIPAHIFRAYDIRGIYNREIYPATMLRIGSALGTYARERGWRSAVVGNDIRASSVLLSNALVSGLLYTGIEVTNVCTTSFGVCAFAGWLLKKDVIAYITASHLPPEWNGLKLYTGEGIGFSAYENERIRDIALADSGSPAARIGHCHELNMRDEYVEYISKMFDPALFEARRIAIDCGNGSMGLVAPEVMERVQLRADMLFPNPDPAFPNRPSEPTETNLGALKAEVTRKNLDFGAAFDGDGDRVVIIDDRGRVLSADQCGTILGKALLTDHEGPVLANVDCSMLIERELNCTIERIPVGHTFLTKQAKQKNAVLGIESSGHYVIPHIFPFDDAMIVPLIIAQIITNTGKRLSELVDELPSYPKERRSVSCSDEVKFRVIDSLAARLSKEYNLNTMDGIRIDLEDGWVLIRASNTSPLIRLTVEGITERAKQELMDKFIKLTEEEIRTLNGQSKPDKFM